MLESVTDDPLGAYRDCGRVDPAYEDYAIDGSMLQMSNGMLYFLYTTRSLWIAPMSDPWRVSGTSVKIADPTYLWERDWLEAPQALVRNGKIFLVYSAGHSAKPHYVLGLLWNTDGDVLNPHSWIKYPAPVFQPYSGPEGSIYTTGHCSFTTSPDGSEDWIIYHAKDLPTGGFSGRTASSLSERTTWRHLKPSIYSLVSRSGRWIHYPNQVVGPEGPSSMPLMNCLVSQSAPMCLIHCPRAVAGRSYPIVRLCKRFRSKAKHTKHHSPPAAASPRSENCRKPSTSFTIPITGSTVHFRSR